MNEERNEVLIDLDNDELVTIETLQYGAYDAANVTPSGGCSCNSNCNSANSAEDPIG